ncbi:hypothetical protein TNCV_835821 [Trichonephila clavipes]|nr:hypothetical protein TNCV_835821 [Trichonephila clavipes]
MACTSTDDRAASTQYHSSSAVETGVWWRASRSTTIDLTFSIGERSGERAGKGNSQTFSLSRKVRTIPTTCGCVLSFLKVGFRRTRIKGRATGRNTLEMERALFKVPSMRTRGDQDAYPIAPHVVMPGVGLV